MSTLLVKRVDILLFRAKGAKQYMEVMHLMYSPENIKLEPEDRFLTIKYKDKENKFQIQDDYPRIWGLYNKTEIWHAELQTLNKFQGMHFTEDFLQPYACFLEEKMWIWETTLPNILKYTEPDLEIFYKDLKNGKVLEFHA